jgi:hypothetical protein
MPRLLAVLCIVALIQFTGPSVHAQDADGQPPPPRQPTPDIIAGADDVFQDMTRAAGIDFVHQFCARRINNIIMSNGSGGAVLDYDNDGWMDIYLVNAGPLEGVTEPVVAHVRRPNALYRNRGDGTFQEVASAAGVEGSGFSTAAAAADFDNDGHTDLFLVNIGRSILYHNRGDGTFEDVTAGAGVGHEGTGVSATFVDADNDGLLDLFLANYLTYVPQKESEQNPGAYPGPLAYAGEFNVLYHNRGDGTFQDVTSASGLDARGRHRAMSVSAFDADWDGDSDLYVCNDDTPNHLWLNDGRGHFSEVGIERGVAFNSIGEAPGSMNAAIADADGDGGLDLFITRLGYGSLYLSSPDATYVDRMYNSGLGVLTQRYVGWGGAFVDYDNDSNADLWIANGDAFTLEGTRPLLLRNVGAGAFANAAAAGGAVLETPINGRGAAVIDYDNDGRLDVLMTALADRAFLLRNRHTSPGHWLKLRLEGTRSNRSGFGAHVTVTAGGRASRAQALCPTGFLLQGDSRVHFGLGPHAKVDRIDIRWPSGVRQVLEQVAADQILTVREP